MPVGLCSEPNALVREMDCNVLVGCVDRFPGRARLSSCRFRRGQTLGPPSGNKPGRPWLRRPALAYWTRTALAGLGQRDVAPRIEVPDAADSVGDIEIRHACK